MAAECSHRCFMLAPERSSRSRVLEEIIRAVFGWMSAANAATKRLRGGPKAMLI